MRPTLAIIAVLLAGCATHREEFSAALPSLRVGQVALQNGEPGIAASVADTRLAKAPGETDALLLRAQAEAALNEPGPAATDFQRVLAAQPRSVEAALGLARIIAPTDPAGADSLLAPVAARGEATAPVWNNLGVARDLLGRHAEAQDAYRHALAADPSMNAAQVNLARSLTLTPSRRP